MPPEIAMEATVNTSVLNEKQMGMHDFDGQEVRATWAIFIENPGVFL